jgi:hypothetical protein
VGVPTHASIFGSMSFLPYSSKVNKWQKHSNKPSQGFISHQNRNRGLDLWGICKTSVIHSKQYTKLVVPYPRLRLIGKSIEWLISFPLPFQQRIICT